MEVKAKARYIKTTPRKIRLICDLVRGKKIVQSINQLQFLKKQASSDVLLLLNSALANAKQKDLKADDLYIKEIRCDEGPSVKRMLYHSRGRATQVKKRMSHVSVILSDNRESEIQNPKSVFRQKRSAAKAEYPKSELPPEAAVLRRQSTKEK